MSNYIDGFVLPVPGSRLADYQRVAAAVGEIYKEHGALDYLEYAGDDMQRGGTRSFVELAGSEDGEIVVFGWIIYESRDKVNELVEADPRMPELLSPLLDPSNPVFDPGRMAFGGFKPLVGQ